MESPARAMGEASQRVIHQKMFVCLGIIQARPFPYAQVGKNLVWDQHAIFHIKFMNFGMLMLRQRMPPASPIS
jgi:hypothetical protein